ncbi:formin-binding protein [Tieghemiomyces parasiticus]|uniref:Formin-binding protein n=1 Tax=Tieghemiomyces parasiticus TaxID=78921 RepID=A0A9W7ZHM6_9FUNG|nr:formin-binding protein [Tieghemiomyces parasiticus]
MNRLRNSKQTCQELQAMFAARAAIEEEFGKKLLKLARTPLGKNEIGTLQDALFSVKNELAVSAKAHIDLAHQIKVELENTTNDFINKQREKRKLQTAVIEKSSRNRSMVRSQLVKAKDRYDAETSKANGLEQSIMSNQQPSRDADRLRQRLEKTHHSTRQADDDYRKVKSRLSDAQRRWEADWRDACHAFQGLEEERLDFLRTHLWSYTNVLANVLVTEDESYERIRKTLETFSVRHDIRLFIDTQGTGRDQGSIDSAARSRSQSVSVHSGPFNPPHSALPPALTDPQTGRRASAPGQPEPPTGQPIPRPPSTAAAHGSRARPVSVFHNAAPIKVPEGPPRPASRAHGNGDSGTYLSDSFHPNSAPSTAASFLPSAPIPRDDPIASALRAAGPSRGASPAPPPMRSASPFGAPNDVYPLSVNTQPRGQFAPPGSTRIPTPVSLYNSAQSTPTTPTGAPTARFPGGSPVTHPARPPSAAQTQAPRTLQSKGSHPNLRGPPSATYARRPSEASPRAPFPGKPAQEHSPPTHSHPSPRMPPAATANGPQHNAPAPARPPPPPQAQSPLPRRADPSRPVLFYVRAMYDYAAETPEEVSIKQGSIVAVLATHIDGWWEGEVTGADQRVYCGMFPSNFTEPLSF